MKDVDVMMRALHTCAGILEQGKFDAKKLKHVKQMLEALLNSINEIIEKPIQRNEMGYTNEYIKEQMKEQMKEVFNFSEDIIIEQDKVVEKKCCCPEGSLCEFFEKDTENCLYGEI